MKKSNSFSKNLALYQSKANQLIGDYFDSQDDLLQHPEIREYILGGGKRIRGYLLCLGYRMVAGMLPDEIIQFSLGIELGHAGLLIQDDIFDNDRIRRNQPSLHVRENVTKKDAIFLSDMLVAHAYKVMLEAPINNNEKKNKALQYLNVHALKTAEGEFRDLSSSADIDFEELVQLAELKTASYTGNATIVVGALLAGAPGEVISSLERIAQSLGILFQIRDDFLPVFSDQGIAGKDVLSDFKQNRASFLTFIFKKEIGKPLSEITTQDALFRLISKEKLHGAYDNLVSPYTALISYELARLDLDILAKDAFNECVAFIVNREL